MDELARLTIERRDGVVVIHVEGEIDISNRVEMTQAMTAAIPNTASATVVDLSATTYLDSAGVHVLFDLAKQLGQRQQRLLLVVPARAPMRRALLLTHIDELTPIHERLDEALTSIDTRASIDTEE